MYLSKFSSLFYGKPFFKIDKAERINKEEIKEFIDWSNEKIYFTNPSANQTPTWEWLLDTFKEQMYSFGIDIFVIDAFNKVIGANEKKDIDQILTKLTSFAQRNNVIIFLIAHPTKMKKDNDGKYESPDLYSVSGSSDFRNQTHDGYCIYRNFSDNKDGNYTTFINLKTKFGFQGEIGKTIDFNYDVNSGRYYERGTAFKNIPLNQLPREESIEKNNLKPNSDFEFEINNEDEVPF